MTKWIWWLIIASIVMVGVVGCSPYASLDIGMPFKVGPVYVNPRIGVGGFL
mgnify:FL=1